MRQFNDKELADLLAFLWNNIDRIVKADPKSWAVLDSMRRYRYPIQHIRASFPSRIIKLVKFVLFGDVSRHDDEAVREADRLKKIVASGVLVGKQFLPQRVLDLLPKEKPAEIHYSVFPEGLEVRNSQIFSEPVAITKHAWERFCERYLQACCVGQKPSTSRNYYITKFRECFKRARKEKLPAAIATERLINNDFRPVIYLHDPGSRLGFVVSDYLRRQATIITVDPAR